MPPKDAKGAKGKDAKGAKGKGDKGAKGGAPVTGTVTRKVLEPPLEAPLDVVDVSPAAFDPRVHAPPVVYGAFWDFPGRRPQMRPGTAPLARMSGPAAGESGAPAGKGGKGKDAKGAKGKDAKGAKGKDAKKKK
mmetsp:Transcript_57076/g.92345  ORF Transcript_57076/g.92345 Transcript_57076/m.92345 type:complete len:134 (+) Transcript_57076:196-597(+)